MKKGGQIGERRGGREEERKRRRPRRDEREAVASLKDARRSVIRNVHS